MKRTLKTKCLKERHSQVATATRMWITPYCNFAKHTILGYTVSPVGSEKKQTHPLEIVS